LNTHYPQAGTTKRNRGSVSIHELCFILLVLGLLTVITISQLGGVRDRAHQARCVGNLKQINVLFNIYRTTCRRYPDQPLGDFRPLAGLTDDYGILVCPGSSDGEVDAEALDCGTSYRYFSSVRSIERAAARSAGTYGTNSDGVHIRHDQDRGHGNDPDKLDEDNPAWQRKYGQSQYVFDPGCPDRNWEHARGAIYDRDYSHHDGTINIIYLENGRWERIEAAIQADETQEEIQIDYSDEFDDEEEPPEVGIRDGGGNGNG